MITARQCESRCVVTSGSTVTRIGGPGSVFRPEVSVSKWDGEASIAFRLIHDEPGLVSVDQQAIAWTAPSLEARFYALGIVGGGYELAVHLPQKPATNVLRFSVRTNASILYQPSMAYTREDGSTWEPSPLGGIRQRPAWANESYAFYGPQSGDFSRCGGHNYQTGKLGHLHRAWAVDAVGHRVWCRQQIADGVLTITIPTEFLASALYPVMVDPTFGYTTQGGSQDNPDPHNMILSKASSTPASNGTLTAIEMFGQIKTSTPHWAPAIYTESAGAPSALVASIDTGGTAISAGIAVNSTAVSASISSGVQYWLGWSGNKNEGTTDFFIQFDAEAGNTIYLMGTAESLDRSTGANWPATANVTHPIVAAEKVSEYGVYTASGGGGSRNVNTIMLMGVQ